MKKLNQKQRKFILIWIFFHTIAMTLSYSEMEFFGKYPDSEKFWPISDIFPYKNHRSEAVGFNPDDRSLLVRIMEYPIYEYSNTKDGHIYTRGQFHRYSRTYQGIFNRYDWTEFVVYVGAILFYFGFILMNKKEEE